MSRLLFLSSRRRAARASEHRVLPLALPLIARAPFAPLSVRILVRETMALFAWNIRDLLCYSVCFGASENWHLVRVVWRFLVCSNAKRREVAAHEGFRLAGPTGLDPRPPP